MLPADYNLFVEEFRKNPNTTWIMKPCGKGIVYWRMFYGELMELWTMRAILLCLLSLHTSLRVL